MLISSLQRIAEIMKAADFDSPPVLASRPLAITEREVGEFLDD